MQIETITLPAEQSLALDCMPLDVLTRVEVTPTSGWMIAGRPVAEWPAETVRLKAALEYLARKIAGDDEVRAMELEDEALEYADRA
ncbi:MAG: hypothetical protein HGB10_00320 [Coriobacteriia bacterium]|nr:hypothetical protein [Coriobacteriia bacterium]